MEFASERQAMNNNGLLLGAETSISFSTPTPGDGEVVAVGGNLSSSTLLSAYRHGIFPWFSDDDEPIQWWSFDPRSVIFPKQLHLSRSLKKRIRKKTYHLTVDSAFEQVIRGCRVVKRPDSNGTWITENMIRAYLNLHYLGYAHSVEAWLDGMLAGGLYGVSLGGCFCGESMFARQSDASKVAFAALGGVLIDAGFGLIDCQEQTRLLSSFGAVSLSRASFLEKLARELEKQSIRGNWGRLMPNFPRSSMWDELHG